MNLKKKILIGYGVAFSLMGLVVAWAIINLWSLGKTTDAILRDYYRSINAVEKMLDALARLPSNLPIAVPAGQRFARVQFVGQPAGEDF